MVCRGDAFFFTIVLVMTYPVPLRVQQQRFAAQIAKRIDLESKKVLAQQQPVSTKGTIQLSHSKRPGDEFPPAIYCLWLRGWE